MCSSSIAAKLFHVFLSAWTLFPRGHHCALPRPRTSVPTNSSPVRISIVIEFRLLSLVSSTELGRFAITLVRFTRRRFAMPESYHNDRRQSWDSHAWEIARAEMACAVTTRLISIPRCFLDYCFFAGDAMREQQWVSELPGAQPDGALEAEPPTARGRRRGRREHRLIVQIDHFLGDVHGIRGVEHRRVLVAHVEDNREAVLLGELVDHRHHLLPQHADHLLLLLLEFGLGVFDLTVKTLGLQVDIARQIFLGAVGERVASALQPFLQVLDFRLLAVQFLLARTQLGFQLRGGLLAFLGGRQRGLDLITAIFVGAAEAAAGATAWARAIPATAATKSANVNKFLVTTILLVYFSLMLTRVILARSERPAHREPEQGALLPIGINRADLRHGVQERRFIGKKLRSVTIGAWNVLLDDPGIVGPVDAERSVHHRHQYL